MLTSYLQIKPLVNLFRGVEHVVHNEEMHSSLVHGDTMHAIKVGNQSIWIVRHVL